MARLDSYAIELDDLSKKLSDVERKLEPAEQEYEAFIDDFYVGLWADKEQKLPGEDMRLRLARHAMPPELLGRYSALLHSRKRMEKRVSSIKASIDALRSILSALKAEMDASR